MHVETEFTFYQLRDGGYTRRSYPFTCDQSVHVLNNQDYSPVYKHWLSYDRECSCCWLGMAHSEAVHKDHLTVCRAWACKQAPHNKSDHK